MPKNIWTPRDELICGKIDECIKAVQDGRLPDALDFLSLIRRDAMRMEAALARRKKKDEV